MARAAGRADADAEGMQRVLHAVSDFCLLFAAVGIIGILLGQYGEINRENACVMTFIYRAIAMVPIDVPSNAVPSYKLFRYIEATYGTVDQTIRSTDIPVLFVPGSGGASKQVRSVASVMGNKTDSRNAPFRFVFYAADFDEEFSFLSGKTLQRQQEFVVQCIDVIMGIHRAHARKIVLVGHSFGGTVIHSLAAHPGVRPEILDIMILLSAPLQKPPIRMDIAMENFYNTTHRAWLEHKKDLAHVAVLSYSGGLKDVLVPDHLARGQLKELIGERHDRDGIPRADKRIVHLPSWSIKDVAVEADHLCILWCNQLVRHTTRLLYLYGQHRTKKTGKTGRAVAGEFYAPYRSTKYDWEPTSRADLFNGTAWIFSVDEREVILHEAKPYENIRINLFWADVVLHVTATVKQCKDGKSGAPPSLSFLYPEGIVGYGRYSTTNVTDETTKESKIVQQSTLRIMHAFPEMETMVGILRIDGEPGCTYDLTVAVDYLSILYKRIMVDITVLPFVAFMSVFVLAALPTTSTLLPALPISNPFSHISEPVSFGIRVAAISLLTVVSARVFIPYACVFLVARTATFLVTIPLQAIIKKMHSLAGASSGQLGAGVMGAVACACALRNIYLAYAVLLVAYAIKLGAYCRNVLMLCIYSIVVVVAIGLAGGQNKKMLTEEILDDFPTPHPLTYTFLVLLLSLLMNARARLVHIDESWRRKLSAVLVAIIACELFQMTSLDTTAVITGNFIVFYDLFENRSELEMTSAEEEEEDEEEIERRLLADMQGDEDED